jgi:hypothetical protein
MSEASDAVTLPVGLEIDGVRYRKVFIDELTGTDDHLLAGKKASKNASKSTSNVLARCIQEIEGVVPRKKNPDALIDVSLVQKMYGMDRDFILAKIHQLSGKNELVLAGSCPRCKAIYEENGTIDTLDVVEWPEDKPCEVPFELEIGIPQVVNGNTIWHKNGILQFVTGKIQELSGEIDNAADQIDALLCASIKQVGDMTAVDRTQVKKMRSRDRQALLEIIQYDYPGMKMWKTVACENCDREFEAQADITSFFGGSGRRKKTS